MNEFIKMCDESAMPANQNIQQQFERFFDKESCAKFIDLVGRFPEQMAMKGYHCAILNQFQNCQGYACFDILVSKQGSPTGDVYQLINSGVTVTAKFVRKELINWEH